jgi:uncharacterized protein YjbI with pentapeptide repeats
VRRLRARNSRAHGFPVLTFEAHPLKARSFNAHLSNTCIERQDEPLKCTQLNGASLENAQLQGGMLSGVDFDRASLKSAQLQAGDFRQSKLSGVDMSGAELWRTDFDMSSLVPTIAKR